MTPDARPAFVLQNVEGVDFFHVKTPTSSPTIVLRDSTGVEARWVRGVEDGKLK